MTGDEELAEAARSTFNHHPPGTGSSNGTGGGADERDGMVKNSVPKSMENMIANGNDEGNGSGSAPVSEEDSQEAAPVEEIAPE